MMEDYPRNLAEFERFFATDEVCRDYLMHLRWPTGFRCPRCGGGKFWPQRVILLHCAACDYQSSVIAGTIFQDTHAPLTLWFRAMWYHPEARRLDFVVSLNGKITDHIKEFHEQLKLQV